MFRDRNLLGEPAPVFKKVLYLISKFTFQVFLWHNEREEVDSAPHHGDIKE